MRGCQNNWEARHGFVIQLIKLLVDCMPFGWVNLRNTFIQQCLELSFQIFGHILADAIGTRGVGLIPVVGIMNIF